MHSFGLITLEALLLFLLSAVTASVASRIATEPSLESEADDMSLLQTLSQISKATSAKDKSQMKSPVKEKDPAALLSAHSAKEASNMYASSKGRRLLDFYDFEQIPPPEPGGCAAHRDHTVPQPFVPVNSTDVKYFFFSHHKVGAALSRQVMHMMHNVLGVDCGVVDWEWVHNGTGCAPHRIAMYEDTTPESIQRIQQECPNMRAVHLTREAFALSASKFVYTYHLHPGASEVIGDIQRGEFLRSLPWTDAILAECMVGESLYLPQLGAAAAQITADANPNILPIRFEDWMSDFNGTVRTIMTHFFGEPTSKVDVERIDALVGGAAQFDLANQSRVQVEDNEHVTNSDEKENVTQVLAYFNAINISCAQMMATDADLMRYPLPDVVLSAQTLLARNSAPTTGFTAAMLAVIFQAVLFSARANADL